ncbi:hypothetical protein BX666DRAFT_1950439 [Dichotomocladium elegans]|nr:hypothetical protein BX666DRAFT_1950439 [Dichotomocladium elegans]
MSSPIQSQLPSTRRTSNTSSLSPATLSSSAPPLSQHASFAQSLSQPTTAEPSARQPSIATSRSLAPHMLTEIPYQGPALSQKPTVASGPPAYSSSQASGQGMTNHPSQATLTEPADANRTSMIGSRKSASTPTPSRNAPLLGSFGDLAPTSSKQSPAPLSSSLTSQPSTQSTPSLSRSTQKTTTTPTSHNNSHPNTKINSNGSNSSTSSSSSNGAGTPTNMNGPINYRPLNVKDALSYLDRVKIQFSARPDVYNQFLDIMKDFKSQAIHTPGVIERVSRLFTGHPDLISGFNTFLPPGYRIDCSLDPNEPDLIRVTTPTGITVTRTSRFSETAGNKGMVSQCLGRNEHEKPISHGTTTVGGSGSFPKAQPQPVNGAYYQPAYGHVAPHPSMASPLQPVSSLAPPMSSHSLHSASLASSYPSGSNRPQSIGLMQRHQDMSQPIGTSNNHSNNNNNNINTRRTPVEFNHAISYVNKIKNRYANDPDTYKQFLEILQTYQKERKPIQEVYSHVQYLFNNAPDLLHEFKQFLPEITEQPAQDFAEDRHMGHMGKLSKPGYSTAPQATNFLPPSKRKRGTIKRTKGQRSEGDMIAGYPASSYYEPPQMIISAEEVELFDQIRKHIGNKPSYEEFLKTLNLFTQQIIDTSELMKQVEGFLANDRDLFDWFKTAAEIDLKDQAIVRPAVMIPKPDLNQCEIVQSSPSYRRVSTEWQNQPCSGRDQLCWEVLNDEYVSHPIWASEDSGFVASKKNQYEEAMHRCEEERYDYDLNIDANLNTLALLEPIAKKLETMSPEDKSQFRLEPGLGGQSVTIYERIIKKVYDVERGQEVIEMLYNNPARVVPVLLKRLSQKDEEWRKAQSEWNKIWRETDAKNFYRSLDYQGLTFKSNERKSIAVKTLVAEIEALSEEAKCRENEVTNYPLTYPFADPAVFKDITRIIYSYIEKQNGFSCNDRTKIRSFIRIYIPLFFQLDGVVPEGLDLESEEGEDDRTMEGDDDFRSMNTEDDSEADSGQSPSERSRSPSIGSLRRSSRSHAEENESAPDLLRNVLTKTHNTILTDDNGIFNRPGPSLASLDQSTLSAPYEDNGSHSNGAEKQIKNEEIPGDDKGIVGESGNEQKDACISTAMDDGQQTAGTYNSLQKGDRLFATAADTSLAHLKRTTHDFFCNTAFYSFFRLYQMLYERLHRMKQLDAEMQADPHKGKKTNKVAIELKLYTDRFDDIDISSGCYNALLDLIDRFFDGELEPPMFEEKIRYLFVTEAYVLFTVDKLIHAIVKQIQQITMDEKCVELVDIFRENQSLEMTTTVVADYRRKVEDMVGLDEHLYRVNFNTETHQMTICLLDKDQTMIEPGSQEQQEIGTENSMDWANETDEADKLKIQLRM